MLLIQVREWFGPGRECPESARETAPRYNQNKGFVTRLSLGAAITELNRYSIEFQRAHPAAAIEFSVLSVSEVPDLTDDERRAGDLRLIENLVAEMVD